MRHQRVPDTHSDTGGPSPGSGGREEGGWRQQPARGQVLVESPPRQSVSELLRTKVISGCSFFPPLAACLHIAGAAAVATAGADAVCDEDENDDDNGCDGDDEADGGDSDFNVDDADDDYEDYDTDGYDDDCSGYDDDENDDGYRDDDNVTIL